MYRFTILATCAALLASPAGAETLPVSGIYPAGNDAAARVRTIVAEPFGGADGPQLGIAIGDALRAARIDGEAYFRVLPASANPDGDAVLQGTATGELGRREADPREEETCVERDEDGKCIRKAKEKIPCWIAVARLDSAVRLIGIEGDVIYAADQPGEQAQRYCRGEQRPSGEEMLRQIADRIAERVRADLAPVQRFDEFRVMEARKGLSDADGRAFREAVRLTKSDHAAACGAWAALEADNPEHTSVLFNLGLCAESRGELEQAQRYYRRAFTAGGDTGYAGEGLRRLEERRRAELQLSAHGQV